MGCRQAKKFVIENSRIGGFSPLAASASMRREASDLLAIHCMFDWPEASQTSPTSRFLRVTIAPSPSVMSISAGCAFALSGASSTIHLPSSPASVDFFCPAKSTVTLVPGLLQPQTGRFMSRWSTALFAKGAPSSIGGSGFADAVNATSIKDKILVIMVGFNESKMKNLGSRSLVEMVFPSRTADADRNG